MQIRDRDRASGKRPFRMSDPLFLFLTAANVAVSMIGPFHSLQPYVSVGIIAYALVSIVAAVLELRAIRRRQQERSRTIVELHDQDYAFYRRYEEMLNEEDGILWGTTAKSQGS